MKILLSFIALLALHLAAAQKLEWVCRGGENLGLSWKYSAPGKNNCIVLAGNAAQSSLEKAYSGLHDGLGKIHLQKVDRTLNILACFTPDGIMRWNFTMGAEFTDLRGIATDLNGKITALIYVRKLEQDESGKPLGVMPEVKPGEFLKVGHYLVSFDENGKYTDVTPTDLDPTANLDVSDFKFHPQSGGFAIAGAAWPGRISLSLNVFMGKGGGDFVLLMNAKGKTLWLDAISFTHTKCCVRPAEPCRIAVGSNGFVYIGGTYLFGGEFGRKIVKVAPETKEKKPYPDEEVYLACYSHAGRLNWIKTAQCAGRIRCIASSGRNVVLSFKSISTDRAFGEGIDTTGAKFEVMSVFDAAGKWQKNISANGVAEDMEFDKNGQLLVLGQNNDRENRWYYGNDSLAGNENVFIARFNTDWEVSRFISFNLPVESTHDPFGITSGQDNNYYLHGFIWMTPEIRFMDSSPVRQEKITGTAFLCRVKTEEE